MESRLHESRAKAAAKLDLDVSATLTPEGRPQLLKPHAESEEPHPRLWRSVRSGAVVLVACNKCIGISDRFHRAYPYLFYQFNRYFNRVLIFAIERGSPPRVDGASARARDRGRSGGGTLLPAPHGQQSACNHGLLTAVSCSDTTFLTLAFSHSGPERAPRFSTLTLFPHPSTNTV